MFVSEGDTNSDLSQRPLYISFLFLYVIIQTNTWSITLIEYVSVCETVHDCLTEETCLLYKCENPCKHWPCGKNSICVTVDHIPTCQCRPGHKKVDKNNETSACKLGKTVWYRDVFGIKFKTMRKA